MTGFLQKLVFTSILMASFLVTLPVCSVGAPGKNPAVEYKIKAAFLLNFAKFITWPEQTFTSTKQPFSFCVVGRDPFGPALTPLQSRTVAAHPIKVQYLKKPAETETCQMLFIADSEKENLTSMVEELDEMAIVTVSDIPGFADQGGIIEFVTRQGRLSFRINLARAKKCHLRIHASLLNLAAEVIR